MSNEHPKAVANERGGEDKTRTAFHLSVPDGVTPIDIDSPPPVAVAAHHLDRDVVELVRKAAAGENMTVTLVITPEASSTEKNYAAAWSVLLPEGGSLSAAVKALADRATGDLDDLPALLNDEPKGATS